MNTLINSSTALCSWDMTGDLVLFVKDLPVDFKRDSYERWLHLKSKYYILLAHTGVAFNHVLIVKSDVDLQLYIMSPKLFINRIQQ